VLVEKAVDAAIRPAGSSLSILFLIETN
jgi:hypothetical protein